MTAASQAGTDEAHLGVIVQSTLRLPPSVMQDVKAQAVQSFEAV